MSSITTTLPQTPLNSGWGCSQTSFAIEYNVWGFGK